MPRLNESEYSLTYALIDEEKGKVLKTLTIDIRNHPKTAKYIKERWSEGSGSIYLKLGGQE